MPRPVAIVLVLCAAAAASLTLGSALASGPADPAPPAAHPAHLTAAASPLAGLNETFRRLAPDARCDAADREGGDGAAAARGGQQERGQGAPEGPAEEEGLSAPRDPHPARRRRALRRGRRPWAPPGARRTPARPAPAARPPPPPPPPPGVQTIALTGRERPRVRPRHGRRPRARAPRSGCSSRTPRRASRTAWACGWRLLPRRWCSRPRHAAAGSSSATVDLDVGVLPRARTRSSAASATTPTPAWSSR